MMSKRIPGNSTVIMSIVTMVRSKGAEKKRDVEEEEGEEDTMKYPWPWLHEFNSSSSAVQPTIDNHPSPDLNVCDFKYYQLMWS